MSRPEPATGSDPGEWSCSDDESPEAAVSAGTKASPTAANGRSRNRSGSAGAMPPHARSGNSRHQPASGRCGVSPLEWGGRDKDSRAGKDISQKIIASPVPSLHNLPIKHPYQFPPLFDCQRSPLLTSGADNPCGHLLGCLELTFGTLIETWLYDIEPDACPDKPD